MTRPFASQSKVQREPALSAAVLGQGQQNRVSIIRIDIRVSSILRTGAPVGSEDNDLQFFSVIDP